jgi:hypothetical protein
MVIKSQPTAVQVAFATNLATCDLLYAHTAYPPAFAYTPVGSSARGAYSVKSA